MVRIFLGAVRCLTWVLLLSSLPALADRILDERVTAALMRLELRAEQQEPFGKILEEYYSRRNTMLRREMSRSSGDELVRKVRNKLKGISERGLKDMAEVLDTRQMVDAESLLDAADGAFLADLRAR